MKVGQGNIGSWPVNLKSKLPHVGTTIFSLMSKLATECDAIAQAYGFDADVEELIAPREW